MPPFVCINDMESISKMVRRVKSEGALLQIILYEVWQRNGRSAMLMLLFVISLFLNASALASIIALLIALIQCVSRCKQKRPIQDGDAHLKQPGCATAVITFRSPEKVVLHSF